MHKYSTLVTKGKGLQAAMFGLWVKSDYNLKEFLNGDAGHFMETTQKN